MIKRFELFTTTITHIYKNLQRIKLQEMTDIEFDLRGTHVMCLFQLNRHKEGLTVTQLSNLCGEDKAATSRTVSELTQKGLIIADNDKRYRAPFLLTEQGQLVADKIDAQAIQAVTAGSEGLTDEEREIFYKALTTISENLKNYSNEQP